MFLLVSFSTSTMMDKACSNQVPSLRVGMFLFYTVEPRYFPSIQTDWDQYSLISIWRLRIVLFFFFQLYSISPGWSSFLHLLTFLSNGWIFLSKCISSIRTFIVVHVHLSRIRNAFLRRHTCIWNQFYYPMNSWGRSEMTRSFQEPRVPNF